MEDLKVLKKMRLLAGLSSAELSLVGEVLRPRRCSRGSTIIVEGSRGASIFLVKHGELKVTHLLRGKRKELGTFRTGDHFGELSFIDRKPRSATIYATEESELLVFSRAAFESLLARAPQIRMKVLQALLEDLCSKLRERHDVLDLDLSDLLPICVFETDNRGMITFSNRTGLESFGYLQKDFEKGLNFFEMIAVEERSAARKNFRSILKGGSFKAQEYTGVRKNGTRFPVMLQSETISQNGRVNGIRATLIDITERKRAEVVVQESEQRYRTVAETAKDAILTMDDRGKIHFANHSAEKIFGFRVAEIIGQSIHSLIPNLMRGLRDAKPAKQSQRGHRRGIEFLGIHKSGQPLPVEISFGEYSKDGKMFRTCIIRDISERKKAENELRLAHSELERRVKTRTAELLEVNRRLRDQIREREIAEEALQESERRFRHLLQNVQMISVLLDHSGRVMFCNQYLLALTGYRKEEVIGSNWFTLFHPQEGNNLLQSTYHERMLNPNAPPHWESEITTRSGDRILIAWSSTVLRDSEGVIIGTASLGRDITESRRALEALRQSEKRYRNLVETMHEFVAEISLDGRFQFVNRPFLLATGYSYEDLFATDFYSYVHEEDRDSLLQNRGKIHEQQQPERNCEYRFRKKDGSYLRLIGNSDPIYDESGNLKSILLVSFDVTDYKQTEERNRELLEKLQKAQMMEAMGRLVAGVAHEVRNPLNAIQATADAMLQDLGEHPEHRPALEIIGSQVNRLSSLMRELLELGSPMQPSRMSQEALQNLCVAAIQLWKQTHRDETHRILMDSPRQEILVKVDAARMQQVLLNLFDNAAQHSSPGAEIRVQVSRNGVSVIIRVIDRGTGIRPENLPFLFEPFFTTRRGGTGLGLSLVKHAVESCGGDVVIFNNAKGPGCTVEVRLPAWENSDGKT